jgi:hypothetical protein
MPKMNGNRIFEEPRVELKAGISVFVSDYSNEDSDKIDAC